MPDKSTPKPSSIEQLNAAFRSPEFARDLAIYLIGGGQIPPPRMTPEEFDAFFGARPMSPQERAEYEEALEQGKRFNDK